jgi:hypothetical protein
MLLWSLRKLHTVQMNLEKNVTNMNDEDLEKQRRTLEICLLMLKMSRRNTVCYLIKESFVIFLFGSPFLSLILFFALLLNAGDQSDLHVIIFDEIDAICKGGFCFLDSHHHVL